MRLTDFPVNSENRTVLAEAFHLALAELSDAGFRIDNQTKEELVDAILSLGVAGQKDPAALARYAVSKCRRLALPNT